MTTVVNQLTEAAAGKRFDRAFMPFRPSTARIDPFEIDVDPSWNVRDMHSVEVLEHITSLKESIASRGVDRPIQVKYDQATGRAKLVDGLCRLTAVRELIQEGVADIKYIPAEEVRGDVAELQIKALTANSGRPFTQLELGQAVKRLVGWGWSVGDIAAQIAKSKRYVTESLAAADLSLPAKELVKSGEVSTAAAVQALKKGGEGAVRELQSKAAAREDKSKPLARDKEDGAGQRALKVADQLVMALFHADEIYDPRIEELAEKYAELRGIAVTAKKG